MKDKITGYYSVIIGISVAAMWVIILLTDSLPEGRIELAFHLFSEFLMALLCVISGILLLIGVPVGRYFNVMALGMVIYSVLNAAGYYGEANDLPVVIVFVVIFILTSLAIILNLQHKKQTISQS